MTKEVAAYRPSKPLDWEQIAARLSEKFSSEDKQVDLKGRGCRERLERLLDKHKAADAKALKWFVGNFRVYMYLHLVLTKVL